MEKKNDVPLGRKSANAVMYAHSFEERMDLTHPDIDDPSHHLYVEIANGRSKMTYPQTSLMPIKVKETYIPDFDFYESFVDKFVKSSGVKTEADEQCFNALNSPGKFITDGSRIHKLYDEQQFCSFVTKKVVLVLPDYTVLCNPSLGTINRVISEKRVFDYYWNKYITQSEKRKVQNFMQLHQYAGKDLTEDEGPFSLVFYGIHGTIYAIDGDPRVLQASGFYIDFDSLLTYTSLVIGVDKEKKTLSYVHRDYTRKAYLFDDVKAWKYPTFTPFKDSQLAKCLFFFSTQETTIFGKKPMFDYNPRALNSLIMVRRKYYIDGHIEKRNHPYFGTVLVVVENDKEIIVDYVDTCCFTMRQRYLAYWKKERGQLDTYVDPSLNYDESFTREPMRYNKPPEKDEEVMVADAIGSYQDDERDYQEMVSISYKFPTNNVNPERAGQIGWRMIGKDTQFSYAYVVASDSCIGHCVYKFKENMVRLIMFNGDIEGHVMISVDDNYEHWMIYREHEVYPQGYQFYYVNHRKHVRFPRRYPYYGRKGNDFVYYDVYVQRNSKDDAYWRDRSKFYYKYPEDSRYTERTQSDLLIDLHSSAMYGFRSEFEVNAPTFEMLAPMAGEYWDRDFNDYSIIAPNSYMEMNFYASRKDM